ncbi:MAG: DUF2332 domain-containing protein [Ilumatobacteraceae bacterium]
MTTADDLVARRFREFEQHGTRAPMYAAVAQRIAADPEVRSVLQSAPAEQQLPVLLFAAVHLLVLEGLVPDLAMYYPNMTAVPTAGDAYPAFRGAVLGHRRRLEQLISTRHTQTNEIGRCATMLPGLAAAVAERGPISIVDVGASAGLNLQLDRYCYDYGSGIVVGRDSSIVLHCSLRGQPPSGINVPTAVPVIAAAVGLDAHPIDVTDDDEVRWLEACVWPDMADRFHRLVDAVALARTAPPTVERGDAVADVGRLVARARMAGHPVVTTSWVLNYLSRDRQMAFVDELDRAADGDLTWIVAESPAETPGLPVPTTTPPEVLTVVSVVRWRGGERTVQRIGSTHPHGYWLAWDAGV